MKIAHLVIGGDIAGGQLVALRLAEATRAAGHEVLLLSPSAGEFIDRATAEGFDVRILRLGGALDPGSLLRLRRLLRHEQVDIVHTHAHFSLNVLGRIAGRLAGASVVAHAHIENVYRSRGFGARAQRLLDNASVRLCGAILAVSESTRQALLRQGYPTRVEVVYNGIETPHAGGMERPAGIPSGVPILLHVGRLAPVKGQHELIEAVGRLEEADAVAVLVGKEIEGTGYRQELERLTRRLGVAARVVFAGFRADVPALLAAADILVLPSHAEGLPLVVLEAMAAGKPVVATAVGGTAELVADGETGLLVPPRDAGALTAALDRLLANPTEAQRFGEAGRRRVQERFTAEAQVRRVLAVYAEVRPTLAA